MKFTKPNKKYMTDKETEYYLQDLEIDFYKTWIFIGKAIIIIGAIAIVSFILIWITIGFSGCNMLNMIKPY